MKITAPDIEVLARTVYGEARGESALGKLAVAWVVVNRAKRARSGLAAACLKSIHFSCWNNARANDANQLAMMTADLSDPVFARCVIAALQAAHGLAPDPTGGARHYHALGVRPRWARGKSYETIGRHRFYRGID
ncbi:MAG TPA: cell wall hydrolase [Aurantimonas coralicida]|uniref:Cell wall hydrolase n=2 Tax=root TaxID=1 RepID=A0A9C9TGJ3_9HYPH|nr:cell wall hydrolase [Aurantimonas coralicida]HEU00540.1 cell wall hydrolase [Aurantimonas coralicida]